MQNLKQAGFQSVCVCVEMNCNELSFWFFQETTGWIPGGVWAWMISFPLGHYFALAGGGQQTCYSQDPFWSLLVDQAEVLSKGSIS